jgi:hypothetical protein
VPDLLINKRRFVKDMAEAPGEHQGRDATLAAMDRDAHLTCASLISSSDLDPARPKRPRFMLLLRPLSYIMADIIDLTNLPSSSEHGEGSETELSDSLSQDEDVSVYSDGLVGPGEELLDAQALVRLREAIQLVSENKLRSIVLDLVENVPEARQVLSRELLVIQHREYMPRWESCRKCGEDFDVNAKHEDTECEFHPGMSTL